MLLRQHVWQVKESMYNKPQIFNCDSVHITVQLKAITNCNQCTASFTNFESLQSQVTIIL